MKDVLKDSHGKIIGSIEKNGTRQKLYDVSGSYLGEYDGHYTKVASGHRIGSGNLLVMLLKKVILPSKASNGAFDLKITTIMII